MGALNICNNQVYYKVTAKSVSNLILNVVLDAALAYMCSLRFDCAVFTVLLVISIAIPAIYGSVLLDRENSKRNQCFKLKRLEGDGERRYSILRVTFSAGSATALGSYVIFVERILEQDDFVLAAIILASLFALVYFVSDIFLKINVASV